MHFGDRHRDRASGCAVFGVVTEEDADSAVVVDMARNILGNPYEDESEDPPSEVPPEADDGVGDTPSVDPGSG